MNSSEKENLSPLARLKEKWRTLQKSEQDYWRAQFTSSRTSKSIRSEMGSRLGVMLFHDVQLTHFRKWVADQDTREAEAERMRADEANLDFGNPANTPSLAAVRWLYRQCLMDLQRHAMHVMLWPEDRRSFRKYAQKKLDEFHWDVVCLCALAWMEQPASLNYRN